MQTFPQALRSRFALQSALLFLFSILCLVAVGGARAGAVTALSSVSVSPATIVGGTVVTGTIALTGAAPAAGVSVVVTSSNANIAVLASPVTIASGAASKTFAISTKPVAVPSAVTITASYGGVVKTATLTVTPPALSSVAISPVSVLGGAGSTGVIRMTGFAAARISVTVTSSSASAATLVSPVIVAPGAYYNSFAITTKPVSVATVVTITASYAGVVKTATLTVTPPVLSALTAAPLSVVSGATSTGTVTLNALAAPAGASVAVSSSNTNAATVTGPVVVAGATQSKTFTITTKAVAAATNVTITASFGGVIKTGTLTVTPASLSSLTIAPVTAAGGSSVAGTITLTGFAPPAGASVAVVSSNPNAVTVAAPVLVAAGTASKTLTVVTKPVSVNTVVTLSATYASVTKTATLTVTPLVFTSITLAPHVVIGGKISVVTVTLNGPAPAAGAAFTLTSSNPALAPVASPLVIPAGATSRTYSIVTKTLDVSADVTITASYGGVTRSAVLTLAPSPPPPPMRASVARPSMTSYVGNVVVPTRAQAGASLLALSVTSAGAWTGTITQFDRSGHTISNAATGMLSNANVLTVKYNDHGIVTWSGPLQSDPARQTLSGLLQEVDANGQLSDKAFVTLGRASTFAVIPGAHSGAITLGGAQAAFHMNVAATGAVLYQIVPSNGAAIDGAGYLDQNDNLFGSTILQDGGAMALHFVKTFTGYSIQGSSFSGQVK